MSQLKAFTSGQKSYNMRFEYLIRACYGCDSKKCDPFGYAAQENYSYFIDEGGENFKKGINILSVSLNVLLYRYRDSNIEELKTLIESLGDAKSQADIGKIVDEGIEIGISLGE